jgi:hypothetical protein
VWRAWRSDDIVTTYVSRVGESLTRPAVHHIKVQHDATEEEGLAAARWAQHHRLSPQASHNASVLARQQGLARQKDMLVKERGGGDDVYLYVDGGVVLPRLLHRKLKNLNVFYFKFLFLISSSLLQNKIMKAWRRLRPSTAASCLTRLHNLTSTHVGRRSHFHRYSRESHTSSKAHASPTRSVLLAAAGAFISGTAAVALYPTAAAEHGDGDGDVVAAPQRPLQSVRMEVHRDGGSGEAPNHVPQAKKKKKERVAVLGAGVVGVTTAYYLARTGHYEVVVIERQPGPAMETSFANGDNCVRCPSLLSCSPDDVLAACPLCMVFSR